MFTPTEPTQTDNIEKLLKALLPAIEAISDGIKNNALKLAETNSTLNDFEEVKKLTAELRVYKAALKPCAALVGVITNAARMNNLQYDCTNPDIRAVLLFQ